MKTSFYKILYKNDETVYVGLTTRTIDKRFREHILAKGLNPKLYSIHLIDVIEHNEIKSLDDFYREQIKATRREQELIKKAKDNGCHLLNLSNGGESWNTFLQTKLEKESFIKKYGSLDGYIEYQNKIRKIKTLLHHWVDHHTNNKAKLLLQNWINGHTRNKTKKLLQNWIHHHSQKFL